MSTYDVAKSFDQRSESYSEGRDKAYSFSRQKRIILDMLDNKKGIVLDAGCGTGDMIRAMAKRGCDAFGLDISKDMLRFARSRMLSSSIKNRFLFLLGDVEALSFCDNTFDAVLCMGVLEYLPSYRVAIQEAFRTLKPGGIAIISAPNGVSPYYLARRGFNLLPRRWRAKIIG
jgi:ubiquinone/menaquinone biosynthesis C-methylase UbiE